MVRHSIGKPQLSLGDLIDELNRLKSFADLPVYFGDADYSPIDCDSWRGIYAELAISYGIVENPITSSNFMELLEKINGQTVTGYKGGDYCMDRNAPLWVANYGASSGFLPPVDGNSCQAIVGIDVRFTGSIADRLRILSEITEI